MKSIEINVFRERLDVGFLSLDFNNLTRLESFFESESLDYIYTSNLFFMSKCLEPLLQEFAIVLKSGGVLEIFLGDNKDCFFENVNRKLINRFFEYTFKKQSICLTKIKLYIPENNSIDSWTFGIITNGKRRDYVEKFIASVVQQNIPSFEIIICGNTENLKDLESEFIQLIPFTMHDDKGWITKKKNLIVLGSKYENICIVHDRYILDPFWYYGMKLYGNSFDVLSCPQLFNGQRIGDWVMHKSHIKNSRHLNELKAYFFWNRYCYMAGGINIFKRSIGINIPYDETLFWNDKEDVVLSRQHHVNGYVLRINPHSVMHALHSDWKNPKISKIIIKKLLSRLIDKWHRIRDKYENNCT
jgi:hypothetical protein